MSNTERKHRDIYQDFGQLLAEGYRLDAVTKMVAFKYYMEAESCYNIFKKQKELQGETASSD